MIPVAAGEYKLVLVGDSAVGTHQINKGNPHFSVNLWMENTTNIFSQP